MRFVLKLDAFAAISGTKFQKLSGLFPRTPLGFAWPSCPPPQKKNILPSYITGLTATCTSWKSNKTHCTIQGQLAVGIWS